MKRGTSALIAASSRTVCVSTITSRNPCSADTTQDAPEHAGVTSEALLKSTLAIATPSSCSRSSLSRAVPWRTSALTLAPRSSRALAMRPPRLPVAPATTMVESLMTSDIREGAASMQGWAQIRVGVEPRDHRLRATRAWRRGVRRRWRAGLAARTMGVRWSVSLARLVGPRRRSSSQEHAAATPSRPCLETPLVRSG